jgi:uncharacterized protein YbjQ (UPF0145 family)|tara:strand:+ start:104 stop:583 length:480 start_codon:yes stop_codon:yes gene_type:complete
MGFTESNVAREHKGLCVACHVKSLVKEKVAAANKPHRPTNVRSIDNLFSKFEDMLVTSETATNLRIRKRFGVVHGEGIFVIESHSILKKLLSVFLKRYRVIDRKTLKNAISDALIELKAAALKAGGNAIVGYDIQYTNVNFKSKEHVIVSVSGTSVETA